MAQMHKYSQAFIYILGGVVALLFSLFGVSFAASAQETKMVNHASIIMYHRFNEQRYPSTNTTLEQLDEHIAYLQEGGFNVMSLPDIIYRFQ